MFLHLHYIHDYRMIHYNQLIIIHWMLIIYYIFMHKLTLVMLLLKMPNMNHIYPNSLLYLLFHFLYDHMSLEAHLYLHHLTLQQSFLLLATILINILLWTHLLLSQQTHLMLAHKLYYLVSYVSIYIHNSL